MRVPCEINDEVAVKELVVSVLKNGDEVIERILLLHARFVPAVIRDEGVV